jgi:hypothetical protein
MDNIIEIFIKGEVGSEKSAIAQEVVDTLRQLNFNVKWDVSSNFNDELDARKIDQVDIENRLSSLRLRNTQIIVREQQAPRNYYKKESL